MQWNEESAKEKSLLNHHSDPSRENKHEKYSELMAGTRPEIDARLIKAIMDSPSENISEHAPAHRPAGGTESVREVTPQVRPIDAVRVLRHRATRG